MASSRVTAPKLLRQLAPQHRSLHLTGAAQYPRIPTTTLDPQPSAAVPQPAATATTTTGPRHFNTSRTLKTVNDSSTMDFAYLPTFPLPLLPQDIESHAPTWQIPILPSAIHRYDTSSHNSRIMPSPESMDALRARRDSDITPETLPFEPMGSASNLIYTVAAESTHIHAPSAMSDVHDADAGQQKTDFHDVVDTVSAGRGSAGRGAGMVGETIEAVREAARKVALGMEREGEEVRQGKGLLKQAWTGLVEDVLGGKGRGGAARS